MAVVIKLRKGTSTQWSTSTLVLALGEVGLETDTSRMKIGNGSSLWTALPYANVLPSELTELAQDAVGNAVSVGNGLTKNYDDNGNVIHLGIDTSYVATVSALTSHEMDTTGIHGIADTSQLATKTYADNSISTALSTHESDTTNIHGITNTADLATKSYADNAISTAISNLINSAPSALNTLKELADALNNDANYASTITTALGTKLNTSDFTYQTITIPVYNAEVDLPSASTNHGRWAHVHGTGSMYYAHGGEWLKIPTSHNPQFTGEVDGITKAHVGLGDVDNTSDANKPVSTATQVALSALSQSVDQNLANKSDKLTAKTIVSTTAYQLTMADMYTRIEFTQDTPITITIPNDGTENLPVGSSVEFLQAGLGKLTIVNANGVSIYGPDNQFKSRVRWSSVFAEKRASNSWLISGDTEA